MQFVSPAQIVFVLWLLTAAAPAATVLINGVMLPVSSATEQRLEVIVSKVQQPSRSQVRKQQPSVPLSRGAEDSALWTVGSWSEPITSSILHTAVQRHRPRIA
jgi:hypothetical protein